MAEHTPGPWYVVGPPWGDGTLINAGSADPHGGYLVARVGIDDQAEADPEVDDANARLIAAAPDLLAAAKAQLASLDGQVDFHRIAAAHRALEAAINKAEDRAHG